MSSSLAIRGSEATLTITVDGERFILLTKTWRFNPDFELKKDEYAGQRSALANPQFNGIDFSWDCDEQDRRAAELANLLMRREVAGGEPPRVTIQVKYRYRKIGTRPLIEIYSNCVLKPGSREQGGRKENITNAFEGFCSTEPKLVSA